MLLRTKYAPVATSHMPNQEVNKERKAFFMSMGFAFIAHDTVS
jgi:hypothetical protein